MKILSVLGHHYQYESGREGDICAVCFSARKGAISVYELSSSPKRDELVVKLGEHKGGKGCLHLTKLTEVDPKVSEQLNQRGQRKTARITETFRRYMTPSRLGG